MTPDIIAIAILSIGMLVLGYRYDRAREVADEYRRAAALWQSMAADLDDELRQVCKAADIAGVNAA